MSDAALATKEVASVEKTESKPYKLVTHQRPDTDAWACLWAAKKFIVKDAEYEICFVPAGERLPPEEEIGYRVIYMDTGKSVFDQHEREIKRTSSFKMLCEGLLIYRDPGLVPIIELTVATDNVETISRTSVHYVLKGLAHYYKDEDSKEIDWQSALIAAFLCFDILYGQAIERERGSKAYSDNKEVRTLENGIKVAMLWNRTGTRNAAFEDGNDVIVAFSNKGKGKFYPLIQVRNTSSVKLDRVIFGLRQAEAKKRNVATKSVDLWAIGSNPLFGGWFFHDSHKMIACGTRGHELDGDGEFTQLSMRDILKVVHVQLGSLPPATN